MDMGSCHVLLQLDSISRFFLKAISSLSQVSVAYNYKSSAYNLGVAVELKIWVKSFI